MSGLAERAAPHQDVGRDGLVAAAGLLPSAPFVAGDGVVQGNLVVVIDRGRGPRRVATGPDGAWLEFRRPDRALSTAELVRDGATVARAAVAVDLFQQAVTRGGRVLDAVNKGKAIAKTGSKVAGVIVLDQARNDRERALGAGLLLAGILLPSEAETRTWRTLPAEVQVIVADLPPGAHDLRLVFGSGAPSVRVPVTLVSGGVTLVWARDVPGAAVLSSP
jgi:hypothetical protein